MLSFPLSDRSGRLSISSPRRARAARRRQSVATAFSDRKLALARAPPRSLLPFCTRLHPERHSFRHDDQARRLAGRRPRHVRCRSVPTWDTSPSRLPESGPARSRSAGPDEERSAKADAGLAVRCRWNYGGGQPGGTVKAVVPEHDTIQTKKGTEVSRKGSESAGSCAGVGAVKSTEMLTSRNVQLLRTPPWSSRPTRA